MPSLRALAIIPLEIYAVFPCLVLPRLAQPCRAKPCPSKPHQAVPDQTALHQIWNDARSVYHKIIVVSSRVSYGA